MFNNVQRRNRTLLHLLFSFLFGQQWSLWAPTEMMMFWSSCFLLEKEEESFVFMMRAARAACLRSDRRVFNSLLCKSEEKMKCCYTDSGVATSEEHTPVHHSRVCCCDSRWWMGIIRRITTELARRWLERRPQTAVPGQIWPTSEPDVTPGPASECVCVWWPVC